MTATSNHSQLKSNPVFWIMLALPAAAVLAGLSTLAIALHSADRPLPAAYHWEGARLEEDFARARTAAAYGIELKIAIAPQERINPPPVAAFGRRPSSRRLPRLRP